MSDKFPFVEANEQPVQLKHANITEHIIIKFCMFTDR